jgi:hypothetical protein
MDLIPTPSPPPQNGEEMVKRGTEEVKKEERR